MQTLPLSPISSFGPDPYQALPDPISVLDLVRRYYGIRAVRPRHATPIRDRIEEFAVDDTVPLGLSKQSRLGRRKGRRFVVFRLSEYLAVVGLQVAIGPFDGGVGVLESFDGEPPPGVAVKGVTNHGILLDGHIGPRGLQLEGPELFVPEEAVPVDIEVVVQFHDHWIDAPSPVRIGPDTTPSRISCRVGPSSSPQSLTLRSWPNANPPPSFLRARPNARGRRRTAPLSPQILKEVRMVRR